MCCHVYTCIYLYTHMHNLGCVYRVFKNLQSGPKWQVPTVDVYSRYAEDAATEDATPLAQASFGRVVKTIFPGVLNRSLYQKGLEGRKNVYIGIELVSNNKENIQNHDIFSFEAQKEYAKSNFHLAENKPDCFSLILFTGDTVNGHRITKEVSINKTTKALSIKVAGKNVKNSTCNVPATCQDIHGLTQILSIIKSMSMCKGFLVDKADSHSEFWGDGHRVKAENCLGLFSNQNKAKICLRCRKRQSYLRSKIEARVPDLQIKYPLAIDKPDAGHLTSSIPQVDTASLSDEISLDELSETDSEPSARFDADPEYDPMYEPSEDDGEDDDNEYVESKKVSEDSFNVIRDMIESLCPSLANGEFIELLRSQVGNAEKSDSRRRRWEPRLKIH